ncbi:hypothetical protein ONS96_000945 [Cadophora gregata f. sp. sojae]|nr:hypothetical protein ONS96_000945 [Cadophora gregata f. sp. sojae]
MARNLMSLSDEVLSMIISEASLAESRDESPKNMSSSGIAQTGTRDALVFSNLTLVNKSMRRLSICFQYKKLKLTASKLRTLESGPLTLRRNVCMFTRELTVSGGGFDWEALRILVVEFSNLLYFIWYSWTEAIPVSILDLLKSRFSKTRLHLQGLPIPLRQNSPVIGINEDDFILLEGIDGCHNISSISAILHSEHPVATRRWMDLAVLFPNLEVLQLQAPSQDPFYLESERAYAAQEFHLQTPNRLSGLRKLVFESNRQRTSVLSIPRTFWNWDKLQHLEIRGRQILAFFKTTTGHMNNLKTLKVERFQHPYLAFHADGSDFDTALSSFILRLPNLNELEVINSSTKISSAVLTHVGTDLRVLSFQGLFRQQARLPYIEEEIPIEFHLNRHDLHEISGSCPNISSLIIDMLVMHELGSIASSMDRHVLL